MRIITWNINSIRARINLLSKLAKQTNADIICLQETKTPDEKFPLQAVKDMGFNHVFFNGMKSYNGVAILSKLPIFNKKIHKRCNKQDCRHISVDLDINGHKINLHNLYIPAGGYEPDPDINDKFQHKLDFVDELSSWFPQNFSHKEPIIALGDMNIAPLENDVWSHKQMINTVSHTPMEVERFDKFYSSMNWVDSMRYFTSADKKLYSWWSYRARDWKKSDRGRRLDHIWVTETLKTKLNSCEVLKEARAWKKPSDHAPVVMDLKI